MCLTLINAFKYTHSDGRRRHRLLRACLATGVTINPAMMTYELQTIVAQFQIKQSMHSLAYPIALQHDGFVLRLAIFFFGGEWGCGVGFQWKYAVGFNGSFGYSLPLIAEQSLLWGCGSDRTFCSNGVWPNTRVMQGIEKFTSGRLILTIITPVHFIPQAGRHRPALRSDLVVTWGGGDVPYSIDVVIFDRLRQRRLRRHCSRDTEQWIRDDDE